MKRNKTVATMAPTSGRIALERMGAMARGARAALGLSQAQVAEALGVSKSALCAFEVVRNGSHHLDETKIRRLAELLRCPPLLDELSRVPRIAERRARIASLERREERGIASPGELVWLWRMREGVTRDELSARSGVSKRALEKLELYDTIPRSATLARLEAVCACGLDSAKARARRLVHKHKHAERRCYLEARGMDKLELGGRLELARLRMGVSRLDAATLSGYSETTWRRVEKGLVACPWYSMIEVLAQTVNEPAVLEAWRPPLYTGEVRHGGDMLRRLRTAAGLSRDMAAALIGCHESTIGRWERAINHPRPAQLARIKAVVGRDPWHIEK